MRRSPTGPRRRSRTAAPWRSSPAALRPALRGRDLSPDLRWTDTTLRGWSACARSCVTAPWLVDPIGRSSSRTRRQRRSWWRRRPPSSTAATTCCCSTIRKLHGWVSAARADTLGARRAPSGGRSLRGRRLSRENAGSPSACTGPWRLLGALGWRSDATEDCSRPGSASDPTWRTIVADSSFARLEDLLRRGKLRREFSWSLARVTSIPAILYLRARELFGLDRRGFVNRTAATGGRPPCPLRLLAVRTSGGSGRRFDRLIPAADRSPGRIAVRGRAGHVLGTCGSSTGASRSDRVFELLAAPAADTRSRRAWWWLRREARLSPHRCPRRSGHTTVNCPDRDAGASGRLHADHRGCDTRDCTGRSMQLASTLPQPSPGSRGENANRCLPRPPVFRRYAIYP